MVSAKRHLAESPSKPARRVRAGYHDDIEAAHGQSIKQRFRDAVGSIIQDGHRIKMKKLLLEAQTLEDMEEFRKSPEQLKSMDKKMRRFYEDQNERLNDWLEVDTLVKHLADDILDSFDPHDDDGDGVPEGGALQDTNERIEPFLPQEERERREKDRRYAKIAINVNVIANIFLLIAKIVAVFFSSSLSLIASLADSALDLLCTVIIWTTSKLVQWKIQPLSKRFPVR